MLNPLKKALQHPSALNPARFFQSPAASGRQIICSFCYIQRIGKRGIIDVWFPSDLHKKIVERLAANDATVLKELGVEWAAIREFSLIKESEFEEDFDAERIKKALRDTIKWRGQDGYRVTVVMLGHYTKHGAYDELKIHDERIQEEITKLIHILYLDKESEQASQLTNTAIQADDWKCAEALPHIVMTLGSMGMTGRGAAQSKKCAGVVTKLLELIALLPKEHIVHDVAVGLALPSNDSLFKREKMVENGEKFMSFQRLLANVFEPLGHMPMSQLHGTESAGTPKYRSHMMRGFGVLYSGSESANCDIAQTLAL
jgi:hypothetical protein